MKRQKLIIIFSGFTAFMLGIYISFFEAKEISEDLVPSQKPQISTNENKFIDIGELRFVLPQSWEQENPSNSMRLAQFLLPDKDKNALIMIEGPRLLFPFARATIATVTREGGFLPLNLQPIDFVAVFKANLKTKQTAKKQPK